MSTSTSMSTSTWVCLFCSCRKDLVRGHVHGKFCDATFGVQNAKIAKGRLPPEDGSDRAQTLLKSVSEFRRFPTFHFSTSEIFFNKILSMIFGVRGKILNMISSFWKSWDFLSVTSRFSSKNDPISPKVQVSRFLGEGVQGRLKFFPLILDQN